MSARTRRYGVMLAVGLALASAMASAQMQAILKDAIAAQAVHQGRFEHGSSMR